MRGLITLLTLMPGTAPAQMPRFLPIPPESGKREVLMAQTETTVEQFAAFVTATGYRTDAEKAGSPRTWKTPGFPVNKKQPVVYVSASDAIAYCAFVDARLPTDDEWEYAARAGAVTRHYWGDTLDSRYLWSRVNSQGRPHPVGKKLSNAWGLYDVEGNVWEWTLSPPDKDGNPLANRRGGSWIDCEDIDGGPGKPSSPLIGLSTYFKVPISLNHRYDYIGFRCARDGASLMPLNPQVSRVGR